MTWPDDSDLFPLMRRKLFTAVVGDILDELGLLHQFLPREIRPLRDDMIVAGRAMPVLEKDLDEGQAASKPFGKMLQALDDLKRDEVYLAVGASPAYALWGELMSARAIRLGAAGAVLLGCSRDTRAILALNFPTFCMCCYAPDQLRRGQVVDFRLPVEIGRARIAPGDIIFGDVDGVLAIPQAAEREVLARALEKVAKENQVRTAIERGMSAAEALEKFGVL